MIPEVLDGQRYPPSMRIDKDAKFFIVVRDETGKQCRIPVRGDYLTLNHESHAGAWIEDAEMSVLRLEIEQSDGKVLPMLTGDRRARMDIR